MTFDRANQVARFCTSLKRRHFSALSILHAIPLKRQNMTLVPLGNNIVYNIYKIFKKNNLLTK
jgi:hypothetical protein